MITGCYGRFWRSGRGTEKEEAVTNSYLTACGDYVGSDNISNKIFAISHVSRPLYSIKEQSVKDKNAFWDGEEVPQAVEEVLEQSKIGDSVAWFRALNTICGLVLGSNYAYCRLRSELGDYSTALYTSVDNYNLCCSDLQVITYAKPDQTQKQLLEKILRHILPAHIRYNVVYNLSGGFIIGILSTASLLDGGTVLTAL